MHYFPCYIGVACLVSGIVIVVCYGEVIPAVPFFFSGALSIHLGRLRLTERDVLLRLTPTQVWTKEFGWQPWTNLVVKLQQHRQGQSLEIHRHHNAVPRFFEDVGTLTISGSDLQDWIREYGNKSVDS